MLSTMPTLSESQIEAALADLPGWTGTCDGISTTYTAGDFLAAMTFMNACVASIESLNHHPEWSNVYNRITISLRTHDAGDVVTDLDIQLAQVLSKIAAEHDLKN